MSSCDFSRLSEGPYANRYSSESTEELFECALVQFEGNVMAHTHHVIVDTALDWISFVKLLSNLQNLDSITWLFWEAPFPVAVKNALQIRWPNAKLWIEQLSIGYRTDDEDVQTKDLDLLKSLVDIPNIHAFKVKINYEHPVSMRWLKDVLLSSHKLEILHLTVPKNLAGRIDQRYDGLGVYDLYVQPDECLDSLKELVYETHQPFLSERHLIPMSFFNWSRIRHLKLRGQNMIHYIKFLNTKDVRFETLALECVVSDTQSHCGDKSLDHFIANLKGVQRLEVACPLDQLPLETLATYGETLESISIRSLRRSMDPLWMGPFISPYSISQINSLNASSPNISYLALDINIAETMPYEHLVALSRFQQLRALRIYLRFANLDIFKHICNSYSQDATRNDWPHVCTDRTTVKNIFSYISMHKMGHKLKTLEVMMGDRPRMVAPHRGLDHLQPDVLFVCCKDSDGKIIVEDDVMDYGHFAFRAYFDNEPVFEGQDWQQHLAEVVAAEEEADRVLTDTQNLDNRANVDSLFEKS